MPIVFRELRAAPAPKLLNQEWFVVENVGDAPLSTQGCAVQVGRGKNARLRTIGTLDPGFTMAPGQKVRVITGSPSKKSQGEVPAEEPGVTNYYLFLGGPLLGPSGTVIGLSLRQHELGRATFDAKVKGGVFPTSD